MTDDAKKKLALDRIRENIARKGLHVYVVLGAAAPRYAYTIGLTESTGAELVLAGASFYSNDDVVDIINDIAAQLKRNPNRLEFEVHGQGSFSLRKVHVNWGKALMLGALDYYQVSEVAAFQLVPDEDHWTVDIPNLGASWSLTTEPVWRWFYEPWTYPVPEKSVAATDLAALRGERITEAMRWEEDQWEIFAGDGPDIPKDEVRVVSLGSLVAADESLVPVVHLGLEEGLLRDPEPDSEWRPWHKQEPEDEGEIG